MSDKTTLEILKGTRELISDPARWTQSAFARSASGRMIASSSALAVCWCVAGAINRVAATSISPLLVDGPNVVRVLSAIGEQVSIFFKPDWVWLTEWNDIHTHPQVLEVLDKAIAAVEHRTGS